MIFRMLSLLTLVVIATAGLAEAQTFNSDADSDANANGMELPPNVAPDADAPTHLQEGELEDPYPADDDDDDDVEPYYFPQSHMFERPLYVGADQLQHYRGYWQPGGYDQRPGSPFFNSVPNAPSRGPLAGNGPSGYGNNSGMNGNGMQGYNGGVNMNGNYNGMNGNYNGMNGNYNGMNGYAGNNGYNGYNQYNNNYAGSAYGSNYGGGAGTGGGGGAGGDPMSYHFGPGYYRSGDYGHYRFPYYSYRRPWYHPGFAGYNRDTNLPW